MTISKVIVTGGSGFIGTNLVEYYRNSGDEVLNLDTAAPRVKAHKGNWQKSDILDSAELDSIVTAFSPDIIYHLAARTDLDGPDVHAYEANTDGVRNIKRAAESVSNLRRIIFASSMLVCKLGYQPVDDWDVVPTTPYGESKVIGEKIVRVTGHRILPWTIVRPTSIWGPWFDAPYKHFFDAIQNGIYFHPASVVTKRSYGYVGNAVHQLSKLAFSEKELVQSKTFYLADYEPLELRQWAQMIQRAMQVKSIRDVPLIVFKCAAKMGDLLAKTGIKNVPMTSFRLSNMRTDAVFDMKPLENVCGELPYDADRGVRATVEWMKKFGKSAPGEKC